MRTFGLIALFFSCSIFCAAHPENTSEARSFARSSYLLGPGDQILIRAANVPDISEKPIRIDLNGFFSMPMIGRIEAAGQTVDQLQAEIAKRLKTWLEDPDVAVSVAEYQSQPVSVFGEVN